MIKQLFTVENYWEVVVIYDVDYNLFGMAEREMRMLGMSQKDVDTVKEMLESGDAKAVTCSSVKRHKSVVLFNYHKDKVDYLNSIVHEAEHIKQAMLEAYNVEDEGEAPAYTIGYLVGRMWEVCRTLVCKEC